MCLVIIKVIFFFKQLQSQQIRYERLIEEAHAEINELESEIKKLKAQTKNGKKLPPDEEQDEIFEVDDDDSEELEDSQESNT